MAQIERGSDCTPANLMDTYPCLKCMSKSDLRLMLLWLMTYLSSYDLSEAGALDQLLEDSACFTCLSDKQRLQAMVAVIGDAFGKEFTSETFLADTKCLRCLKPGQVDAAIVYLLCQWFQFPA